MKSKLKIAKLTLRNVLQLLGYREKNDPIVHFISRFHYMILRHLRSKGSVQDFLVNLTSIQQEKCKKITPKLLSDRRNATYFALISMGSPSALKYWIGTDIFIIAVTAETLSMPENTCAFHQYLGLDFLSFHLDVQTYDNLISLMNIAKEFISRRELINTIISTIEASDSLIKKSIVPKNKRLEIEIEGITQAFPFYVLAEKEYERIFQEDQKYVQTEECEYDEGFDIEISEKLPPSTTTSTDFIISSSIPSDTPDASERDLSEKSIQAQFEENSTQTPPSQPPKPKRMKRRAIKKRHAKPDLVLSTTVAQIGADSTPKLDIEMLNVIEIPFTQPKKKPKKRLKPKPIQLADLDESTDVLIDTSDVPHKVNASRSSFKSRSSARKRKNASSAIIQIDSSDESAAYKSEHYGIGRSMDSLQELASSSQQEFQLDNAISYSHKPRIEYNEPVINLDIIEEEKSTNTVHDDDSSEISDVFTRDVIHEVFSLSHLEVEQNEEADNKRSLIKAQSQRNPKNKTKMRFIKPKSKNISTSTNSPKVSDNDEKKEGSSTPNNSVAKKGSESGSSSKPRKTQKSKSPIKSPTLIDSESEGSSSIPAGPSFDSDTASSKNSVKSTSSKKAKKRRTSTSSRSSRSSRNRTEQSYDSNSSQQNDVFNSNIFNFQKKLAFDSDTSANTRTRDIFQTEPGSSSELKQLRTESSEEHLTRPKRTSLNSRGSSRRLKISPELAHQLGLDEAENNSFLRFSIDNFDNESSNMISEFGELTGSRLVQSESRELLIRKNKMKHSKSENTDTTQSDSLFSTDNGPEFETDHDVAYPTTEEFVAALCALKQQSSSNCESSTDYSEE